ncbi:ethionine resistance protein [Coemansia sp. RSA 1804]|nr:ethionine resistance protein [Coemansia sp. RSA 1804]
MNSPSYGYAICTDAIIEQDPEGAEDGRAGTPSLGESEDLDSQGLSALQLWLKETGFQLSKALPMAIAGTIRSWTSVLELRALGHIGYKQLAGRSLALLVVNLTGYPLMYGFGGALESLCSQAFTNKRANKRIGIYIQHAMWIFLGSNIFITLFWLHPDIVFRLLAKTDSEVVQYAKTYLKFECVPCGVSGVASFGFSDLATIAVAALGTQSLAIQAVLNSCKSAISRTGSYLGMVVSNRVGNLIGARKPASAFLSTKVSVAMTSLFCGLLAIVMLLFQHSIASFITKDRSLILSLLPLLPLLVIVVVFDMISNVLTGILRGQGRQGIAAVIRVISLYVIALPLAYVLAFTLDLGLYGMWAGLAFGFVLIAGAEGWLVFISDWNGEVQRSIQRISRPKKQDIAKPYHDERTALLSSSRSENEHTLA